MSLKNLFQNVVQKTSDYIEASNIKEKVKEVTDRTIDKVKDIDNPAHYTAPDGFNLFQIPVALNQSETEIEPTEKLKPFNLKDSKSIKDAYARMISLLEPKEELSNAMIVNMKKTYLIVWTTNDRLIITHKEHYKILSRDEVRKFNIESTGVTGITVILNEYRFTGSEKTKIYLFVRKYNHEMTPDYTYLPYQPVTKKLNIYERFKYSRMAGENDAIEENKKLSTLLEPEEYPLVSIYGKHLDKLYVLMLSTEGKFYIINDTEYTIINKNQIQKIELMNKGVFSSELYMDNYYLLGCGPENSVLRLLECIHDTQSFEKYKAEFIENNKVYLTFPFNEAISYQTPSKDRIVIAKNCQSFLIGTSLSLNMYSSTSFDHYELIYDKTIEKDDIWATNVGGCAATEQKINKEEAIKNYERTYIRIYIKEEDSPVLEIPLILMKTVIYNQEEETYICNEEQTKKFLDNLDALIQDQKSVEI